MRWVGGLYLGLALIMALPLSSFAAWELLRVTVMGTTYTVILRDATLYRAPKEGQSLPADPLLSGEYVGTYTYDGSGDVATFEAAIKREIIQRLSNLNNQIAAKEAVQKDVTLRFK